jgi:serine phosphatase RsbU (regulator of sigma subunit)
VATVPPQPLGWTRLARYTAAAALLVGLSLTSLYSYDLFHSLVEIFGVVVSAAVFVIAWNARSYFANNYVLCLGAAFLFMAFVDILHTLAYQGVGIFSNYTTDLPTQLWLVARYLQVLAFLTAPLVIRRRAHALVYLAGFGVLTAIFVGLVFGGVFPAAYVPGSGLTLFKIISEYVVCALLLAALWFLVRRKNAFEERVFRSLVACVLFTIASELLFTLYVSPFGPLNLGGHLFKIVAFYMVYKAVVETALVRPYNLLFRELKQSEEALRVSEKEQRHIADVLQEALLAVPRQIRGITFGHLYRPATIATRVSGDFYDVFTLPQGSVGMLVGDVSGHGLEAAALTWVSKDTIKAFAFDGQPPAAALRSANLAAMAATLGREEGTVQFVTAFCGILDTASGRLRYSSAGHPPGIIRRFSGETVLLKSDSPVLGVFGEADYQDSEERLNPGDLLLLYTDGLTEARSGSNFFGEEHLLELLASLRDVGASAIPESLYQHVLEYSGGRLSDDLVILAIQLSQPCAGDAGIVAEAS